MFICGQKGCSFQTGREARRSKQPSEFFPTSLRLIRCAAPRFNVMLYQIFPVIVVDHVAAVSIKELDTMFRSFGRSKGIVLKPSHRILCADLPIQIPPCCFVARIIELIHEMHHMVVSFRVFGVESGKRIENVLLEFELVLSRKYHFYAIVCGTLCYK